MDLAPRDLPRLLEGLSAIAVGTRGEDCVPACALGVAIAADGDGHATLYVPEATAGAVFANLAANGAIAVTLENIPTHRTMQLKGTCREMRAARDDEREVVERAQAEFFGDLAIVGAPHHVMRRSRWPCRAITFDVTEVFEQSPGPRAGLPFRSTPS